MPWPISQLDRRQVERDDQGRLFSKKTMRFNELRHTIGGTSQRMPTLTLRSLERDGYAQSHLTVFRHPAAVSEYRLTDLGRQP